MSNSDAPSLTIDEVRANIDRVDREIVRLLAERWRYARRAPGLRRHLAPDDPSIAARIERVVANVRAWAAEAGAPPDLAERVYRALIAAYTVQQQQDQGGP